MRLCILSNLNLSETSRPIAIKFNLQPHLVGKVALGFGQDRIRGLVSIATDSSYRVIMENAVYTLASSFLFGFSSFLQVTRTTITS